MRGVFLFLALIMFAGSALAQSSLRELEETHISLRENLKHMQAEKIKLHRERATAEEMIDLLSVFSMDPNDPRMREAREELARVDAELSRVQQEIDYLDREHGRVIDQMNQAHAAGGGSPPGAASAGGGTSKPSGGSPNSGGLVGPGRDNWETCLLGQC